MSRIKKYIFQGAIFFAVFFVMSVHAAKADPTFCGWYCPGNAYSNMQNMTGCTVSEVWQCNNAPSITTTSVVGRVSTVTTSYDCSYTCPCNYLGCMSWSGSTCTACNSNGGEPPCSPVGRFVPNTCYTSSQVCSYISGFTGGTWSSCQLIEGAWRQYMTGTPVWSTTPGATCSDNVQPFRSCTKTCTYNSSVASWSSCVNGVQNATSYNQTTLTYTDNNDPCAGKDVKPTRLCGVCNPLSAATTYETKPNAASPSVCAYGDIQISNDPNVFYDKYGENWKWTCKYNNDPDGTGVDSGPIPCTGLNSYIDIGLRIKTPTETIKVAVEKNTCYSPYKIYKGKDYCIGLLPSTDTGNIRSTNARIMTPAGTKIITKIYECTPNCANDPNVCAGTTYPDGCGGNCTGTKAPNCANNPNVCAGTTYPDPGGCGTCTGTKAGTCANQSSHNTTCTYADSCGNLTCTGSVVSTDAWYINDRTGKSCNAYCISLGYNVCIAIGYQPSSPPGYSANTQWYRYSDASLHPGLSVNDIVTSDMKTTCHCCNGCLACP